MNKKLSLTVFLIAFFASAGFASANLTQVELQPQPSFTCNATGTIYYSLSNNQLMLCTSGSSASPVLTSTGSSGSSASFSSLTVSGTTTLATASGNVGIGTTLPNYGLDINVSSGARVSQPTSGLYGNLILQGGDTFRAGHLLMQTSNGTSAFEVYSNTTQTTLNATGTLSLNGSSGGYVGINTTSPATNLDVNGNINVGSVLYDRANTNYYVNPSGNIMPYAVNAGGAINSTAGYYNGGSPVWVTKSMTLSNGPGWYRIISSGNAWLNGTIRLYGTSGNNQITDSMFSISQNKYNHQGSIQVLRAGNYNGSHIANLRLGADGTGVYVDVQFAGISNPTTLYIDYAGQISGVLSTPVFNPTTPTYVGAQMPGTAYGVDNGVDNPYPVLLNPDGYGNVGIGTTAPGYTLQVNGTLHTTAASSGNLGSTSYDLAGYSIGSQTLYSYGAMCAGNSLGQCNGSSGVVISAGGSPNTSATVGLSTGISFFNGGNVGIGTVSPYGKLHVAGIGWADQTNAPDSLTMPTTTPSGGLVLDGVYTDGRYRTRFAKIDRGGNLPLYIQQSFGTANSFTNVARFGSDSWTANQFEVFGSAQIDGSLDVQNNRIINVGTPINAADAATKSYVDSAIAGGSGSSVGYWTLSGSNLYPSGSYNVGFGGQTSPVYNLDVGTTAGTVNIRGSSGQLYANNISSNTGGTVYINSGNNLNVGGTLATGGTVTVGNSGSGGPFNNGSLLCFGSGTCPTNAGGTDIQENWGLNISGTASQPVKINNTSLLVGYTSGSGSSFPVGNLLVSGNVGIGIGVTTPATTLDVNGNINVGSVLYDRANTNYYVNPSGNIMPYAANLGGSLSVKGDISYNTRDMTLIGNASSSAAQWAKFFTITVSNAWENDRYEYFIKSRGFAGILTVGVNSSSNATGVFTFNYQALYGSENVPFAIYESASSGYTGTFDVYAYVDGWTSMYYSQLYNNQGGTGWNIGTITYYSQNYVNPPSGYQSPTYGGVASNGYFGVGTANPSYPLSVVGSMYSVEVDNGTATGATTIDWSKSNTQTLVLGASPIALTFSNGQPGAHYTLALKQDGTGSRTVTWPGNVRWSSGVAPTLTTTANKTDYVEFVYDGLSSTFDGVGFNANF